MTEKLRNVKESMICLTPKVCQTFLSNVYKAKKKKIFLQKKGLFKEKEKCRIEQKNEMKAF